MNPALQQYLDACFRRTTQSLRWIGFTCLALFGVVFLIAMFSILSAPKIESGMWVGLAVIAAFMAGSHAVFAHADRVQRRLNHVFFEAPEKVIKIEAKIVQSGPVVGYMFHLYSPKPTKMVGISVPNKAMFDALRTLLPKHFPNANSG
jgi:hypothetical protein